MFNKLKMTLTFILHDLIDYTNIRLCQINGITYGSILDIIDHITKKQYAKTIWARINKRKELNITSTRFSFVDQSRATPITDGENMMRIIYVIPGKEALNFRNRSPSSFLNINLISVQNTIVNQIQGNDLPNLDKTIRYASHSYNQTTFYIRARLPNKYINTNATNIKQLTMLILKFGIAFCMNTRNKQYINDPDNGYFIFSFPCKTRAEAAIVESILRSDFSNFTVLNSYEYVDTTKLAEFFDMPYSSDSYDDYMKLGQRLYIYVLQKIKAIWPEKYAHDFGFVYNIIETIKPSNENIIELSYPDKSITSEMATQMGLNILTRPELELKIHKLEKKVLDMQIKYETRAPLIETETTSTISPDSIISRDIITGEEFMYRNSELAANSCDFSSTSLRRSYIDKARQFKGRHWRSIGKQYWIPPKGFHFDINHIEPTIKYISATEVSGEVHVYESLIAAAKILKLEKKDISNYIDKKEYFKGYLWSNIQVNEWGTWAIPTNDQANLQEYKLKLENGINNRCKGKIIAHDLTTHEEIVYESVTRAAAFNDMCANMLTNSFLDKPRQARGKHFRSITSKRMWSPPDYFKYNKEDWEKKTSGYVMSFAENDENDKVMYESIKAAHELENINVSGIQQFIDSGKSFKGRIWRKLPPEYVEAFFVHI